MCELADKVMESITSKPVWCVDCILDYNDAVSLVKELIKKGKIKDIELELLSANVCGYDREYIVTVDNEMTLYCEKLYSEKHGVYNSYTAECVYVMDYCNCKCVTDYYDLDTFTIVTMGEKDEAKECSDCCLKDCCCEETDDDLHSFSRTWQKDGKYYSLSCYSTEKDFIDDLMDVFK